MPEFIDSPSDDVTSLLMRPNLNSCIRYRRLTAFFRPSVLKRWGKESIESLLDDERDVVLEIMIGGTDQSNIQLLDKLKTINTLQLKEDFLREYSEKIFEEAAGLNERQSKDRQVNIIRYLVAKEKLKFKLSFAIFNGEYNLDHRKCGYFEKEDGEIVCFQGSMNESDSAYLRHGEELTIWYSNNNEDSLSAMHWKKKLDALWNEVPSDSFKVITPNDSFIDKAKSMNKIKDSFEAKIEWSKLVKEWDEENLIPKPRELRKHQKVGLNAWNNSNRRGILEHATGSGKTFTAINAIEKIALKRNIVAIIGVPYTALADQWSDELNSYFHDHDDLRFNGVLECYESTKKWWISAREELQSFKRSCQEKVNHLSVIVVVNNSLKSDYFQDLMAKSNINASNLFVIGDECHNYTSSTYLDALPQSELRLGLSATPIVNKDYLTEGEQNMIGYFGDVCDIYTLKNGIEDGWLSDYYYYPHACYLNEQEFQKWHDQLLISGKQSDEYEINKEDPIARKNAAKNAMFDVIDSCDSKYEEFKELINNMDDKEQTLVFCSEYKIRGEKDRDIDNIANLMRESGWQFSKITAEINKKREQRTNVIRSFVRGDTQSILAMKVLDEGIDIPSIKTAIILASSRNRRQFVQRRGRVLRKSPGKEFAVIHDFIILPPPKRSMRGDEMVEFELKRVREMAENAQNISEVNKFIKKIEDNFKYSLRD